MKRAFRKSGFTLLELLVTISIVAGIVTAILACFEGGFRVYARIRDFGTRETDVYLAGEQLQRDLQNALFWNEQQFSERQALFYTLGFPAGDLRLMQLRAPADGGLYVWSGDPPVPYGERAGMQLIADDLDVTFAYARAEEPDQWVADWEDMTNLPFAVRLQVEDRADTTFVVDRTVLIQSGVRVEAEDQEP